MHDFTKKYTISEDLEHNHAMITFKQKFIRHKVGLSLDIMKFLSLQVTNCFLLCLLYFPKSIAQDSASNKMDQFTVCICVNNKQMHYCPPFARKDKHVLKENNMIKLVNLFSKLSKMYSYLSSTSQSVTRLSHTDVQAEFPDVQIPHNIFRVIFRSLLLLPLLLQRRRWYALKYTFRVIYTDNYLGLPFKFIQKLVRKHYKRLCRTICYEVI